jgi:hypothetical protein
MPPTEIYTPSDVYRPINHRLFHKEPPASICTAALAAIDEVDAACAAGEATLGEEDAAAAVNKEEVWYAAAEATIAEENSREDCT